MTMSRQSPLTVQNQPLSHPLPAHHRGAARDIADRLSGLLWWDKSGMLGKSSGARAGHAARPPTWLLALVPKPVQHSS